MCIHACRNDPHRNKKIHLETALLRRIADYGNKSNPLSRFIGANLI